MLQLSKILTCFFYLLIINWLAGCDEGKQRDPAVRSNSSTPPGAADSIMDSINVEHGSVKADEYYKNVGDDSLPPNILQQIPADYLLLNSANGDLNKDNFQDWLVALRHKSEDSVDQGEDSPWPRKLLIFTGGPNDMFEIKYTSDSALYCKTCGGMMGDPFTGFTIKNGYFSIENFGGSNWRWSRTVTFKYDTKQLKWFLYEDGHESFHTSDVEKVTSTILTAKDFGAVPFEQFNIFDN